MNTSRKRLRRDADMRSAAAAVTRRRRRTALLEARGHLLSALSSLIVRRTRLSTIAHRRPSFPDLRCHVSGTNYHVSSRLHCFNFFGHSIQCTKCDLWRTAGCICWSCWCPRGMLQLLFIIIVIFIIFSLTSTTPHGFAHCTRTIWLQRHL